MVGKYSRVLPVMNIRRRDTKKVSSLPPLHPHWTDTRLSVSLFVSLLVNLFFFLCLFVYLFVCLFEKHHCVYGVMITISNGKDRAIFQFTCYSFLLYSEYFHIFPLEKLRQQMLK